MESVFTPHTKEQAIEEFTALIHAAYEEPEGELILILRKTADDMYRYRIAASALSLEALKDLATVLDDLIEASEARTQPMILQ